MSGNVLALVQAKQEYVNRAEVATDVREWVRDGQIIGEELSAIVVLHDGSSDPVHTVHAARLPKESEGEAFDDLVELICSKIERDARQWNGTHQQYFVEARHGHRTYARITVGLTIDDKPGKRGRTEKPNEEGVASLCLRYLDRFAERQVNSGAAEVSRLSKLLDESYKREEAGRHENMALRAENDILRTAKELREQNARTAERRDKMIEELFRDLKTYAPTIINRMADKDIVPMGELAPEQMLLRQMVRELDGPEVAGAIKMLTQANPRVAVMLAELVLKVKGEDARRDRVSDAAREIIADAKKEEDAAKVPAAPQAAEPVKLNGSPAPKAIEAGHRESGGTVFR
jgi:hypothetical protein